MPATANEAVQLNGDLNSVETLDDTLDLDLQEFASGFDSVDRPTTLQSALKLNARVSAEEEESLFARLHFLKFRREALASTLDSSAAPKRTHRQIKQLSKEIEFTRNCIAERFLRLLASIARQVAPSQQDFDDFFSEGSTVLIRAIDRFDHSRGFRFSTYATHAVRRHLYRLNKRRTKQEKRETAAEMSFRSEPEEVVSPHELTDQEAADATEMLLEQIRCSLDDREREIVVGRFGLGEDPVGKSFQAMSDYMGLSKERIRQLFYQALRKLSQSVQPHFH